VLKDGANATPEELRAFLAKSFAKWQLPDAFVFLPEIPRTSVGKIQENRPARPIRKLELGTVVSSTDFSLCFGVGALKSK
jgi:acyl-CoA synthetase (AMP-forming)/AMP-acid ligase II